MNNKYQELLIFYLIGFYLIINFYTKNMKGIILFLVSFLIFQQLLDNILLACIMSYCLSIMYGIYTKYHLFENFSNGNQTYIKDLKRLITDRLLNRYIKKKKNEDNTMIMTREVKILDLSPSISNLRAGKIKNMKNKEKILNKPIVITNDNKIIDGHHRWYIKKSKVNHSDDNDDSQFIKAIIISSDFREFIEDIREFKESNNEQELNRLTLDKTKLEAVKKSIDTIKDNIESINENYKDLEGLNIM